MTRPTAAVPSAWLTLLIFVIIAHFNPEVLTGSTRVENYFTPGNLLGMLFYGFQVAIIADIAVRFAFRWRTILIVGAIYGIFEEGFAVMTMESPTPPGFSNLLRIAGVNVAWATYIALFHALISVVSTMLIVRLVWPNRVSSPFLRRRHYAVIISAMILDYTVFVRTVTSVYTPELSAIGILAIACVALAYLAKKSRADPGLPLEKPWPYTRYAIWALILIILSGMVPYLLALTMIGGFVVPMLVLVCGYSFSLLFDRYEHDRVQTQNKTLVLFSVLVGFLLVFSTFFRTPISNVVAYAGVAVQLYLGWRSVRKGERAFQLTRAPPTGILSLPNEPNSTYEESYNRPRGLGSESLEEWSRHRGDVRLRPRILRGQRGTRHCEERGS